jgi:tetratricopeptide (TPR) repeat protein
MSKKLSVIALLLVSLVLTAFECASPEIEGAKLYIQRKQWDKAEDQLKKEVEKNPKSDEGYKLLGDVYKSREKYDLMLDAYDKSLSISNRFEKEITFNKKASWADCYNKGIGYYNRGIKFLSTSEDTAKMNFNKSIEFFKFATMLQPDSTEAYKLMYQAASLCKKTDDVIVYLENANKKSNNPKLAIILGEVYSKEGANYYNQYKDTRNLSDSLKAFTYLDQGITILNNASQQYPTNKDILLQLASAYISANRVKEGQSAFERLVSLDPTNKLYRYNFGVVLLEIKRYDLAAEQFEKAIEIDPEYINATYNLGVTYVQWAVKLKQEAEDKGVNDESYKEKFKLALPQLEKFLSQNKEDAQVWNLLGKIYANLGMNDKAKEAFENADKYNK